MTNNNELIMEGFLIKQGHFIHNWKTRWFKLSDRSLRYYADRKSTVPLGRIPLQNATLTRNSFIKRENVFILATDTKKLYPLQASTATEMQTWMEAIEKVIDGLDSQSMEGSPKSQFSKRSRKIYHKSDWDKEYLEEGRNVDIFMNLANLEDTVKMKSQKIDGIHYEKVFSDIELLRWIKNVMGVSDRDAEDKVKVLLRTGHIECLTTKQHDNLTFETPQFFRLIADESSFANMSKNCLNDMELHTQTKTGTLKPQTSKGCSPFGPGLPSDLPAGDVMKCGILFKRGHFVPSWKLRSFVLQKFPPTLSYFDPTKKNLKTINKLSLRGASVFPITKPTAKTVLNMSNPPDNLFCVKLADGTLYPITAASQTEMEEWINAIKTQCTR